MKFFRKRKKRPLNFIEVKEKSGVLVQSSKYGCLWIISPFWDVSNPVIINAPGRNIDAVIVINNHIEGCLPLSSFLAADKDIPADKIYVTKIKNHADWHPNYKDQQEINSLVTPIELPETIVIG
ncbi:MAG: hypothetical protein IT222_00235, partial [Crocinitomix sp.]|nr:hypothetical protein [Crocinitomix sp.]